MSIPIDNLYHYIKNIAEQIHQDCVLIYRFFPHGSKKIENLRVLNDNFNFLTMANFPELFCNDQEPLNYSLYEDHSVETPEVRAVLNKLNFQFPRYNFRGEIRGIWDNALLLHSEKRSAEVTKYKSTQFIPVYYWSHALISLDWFRFAQHVTQTKQVQKQFLIYNRAWAGTREYRLYFAELMIRLGLENDCKMSINPIEPELDIHYDAHNFKNLQWRPLNVLEDYFPVSDAHSHYSADFNIQDYEATDIEIILETLFDDSRLHLTEKSLRPIACGQPFILAGTHGSLEYLRSYGFKTFGHVWDERYDSIEDPQERLHAIANLMKQITTWLPHVKNRKMQQAQEIAKYNKKYFFSQEFFNLITDELKNNLTNAFSTLETTNTSKFYIDRINKFRSVPELYQIAKNVKTDEERNFTDARAQKYYMRSLLQSQQVS